MLTEQNDDVSLRLYEIQELLVGHRLEARGVHADESAHRN